MGATGPQGANGPQGSHRSHRAARFDGATGTGWTARTCGRPRRSRFIGRAWHIRLIPIWDGYLDRQRHHAAGWLDADRRREEVAEEVDRREGGHNARAVSEELRASRRRMCAMLAPDLRLELLFVSINKRNRNVYEFINA